MLDFWVQSPQKILNVYAIIYLMAYLLIILLIVGLVVGWVTHSVLLIRHRYYNFMKEKKMAQLAHVKLLLDPKFQKQKRAAEAMEYVCIPDNIDIGRRYSKRISLVQYEEQLSGFTACRAKFVRKLKSGVSACPTIDLK